MTTAKFFTYKGHLACEIDMNGKFINDPQAKSQLGCVIETAEVQMTTDAKVMIKDAKREGGSFSELMLTRHKDQGLAYGPSSIGIIGFSKVYLGKRGDFSIGRDCDKTVLDDCPTVEMEAPDDFKKFVDSKGE